MTERKCASAEGAAKSSIDYCSGTWRVGGSTEALRPWCRGPLSNVVAKPEMAWEECSWLG